MQPPSTLPCAPMRCWIRAIPKDFSSGSVSPAPSIICRRWRVPIMNQSIKIRLVAGFAAVIGLIGSAGPVTAWGPEGHAIISHIAAARLSAEARQQLIALLGSPSAETMAAGANWADEVRRDRPMTAPWHYVNIELGSGG